MTVEQREKIQTAIQALIDVESELKHLESQGGNRTSLGEVEKKLSDARHSLVNLNAPDYN